MKSIRLSLPALVLVSILVPHGEVCAQGRFITFSGVKQNSADAVSIDSIRVLNLSRGRDTLIAGGNSFDIDWLTGTGEPLMRPAGFSLRLRYQEPSGENIAFYVTIPMRLPVQIAVYSILGARIATHAAVLDPGVHSFTLDMRGAANGIFLVAASAGSELCAIKVVKLHALGSGTPRIVYAGISSSQVSALRRQVVDTYTFIGYANAYYPDTLANLVPLAGQNYPFTFVPLPANEIVTGGLIEAASITVAPQGGRVTVTRPNMPVTGMEIEVPNLSYSDPRTFTISYANIISHGFDPKIKILSPLISLSNGGGYADSAMLVKIPIQLPPDYFAMAFYYDRDTRQLEGIPIVALADDAVYVATRHFSSDQLALGKSDGKKMLKAWVDVLVAGIQTLELTGTFSSGFKPGTDDWEFPNYGSYLAPHGHCTGQSLTAMWYYSNKRIRGGAAPLYNLLDQVHTDSMWMDNTHGYRFASVVWAGLDWQQRNNWLDNYFEAIGTTKLTKDRLHYLAFAFSIRNTGQPQLTEIWRQAGGSWKGHAMVVYETDNGYLRIADPNYPGKNREARLDQGTFIPYSSGDNAGNLGVEYPLIQYIAKTALVSFADIADRWKQTFEGTIGTVPPNTFPAVDLFYEKDGAWATLPDTVETMVDTLYMSSQCPTCACTYPDGSTALILADEQGKFAGTTDADGVLRIPRKPGTTRYGISIYGWSQPGFQDMGYIDFKWLTVKTKTYTAASVSSGPLDGHFRYEDRTTGQLQTTYGDNVIEMTSLSTGYEAGIYGTFRNNTYTSDTTYKIMGYFTHTEHIEIVFNDSLTAIREYTISHTRLQDGAWTDNTTITGGNILLETNGRTENYDRFLFEGTEACAKLSKVEYSYQRLDKDHKTFLETFTCRPETKIRIVLTKQ